jgi:hypothetical protein
MKKLAIFSLIAIFALAFVQLSAQDTKKAAIKTEKKESKTERKELRKLEGNVVDVRSKNAFITNFGNVPDVNWKRTNNFDEATFTKDGKKMTSFFDFDSNLVGTTVVKSFADLPSDAQKEVKLKYKDYKIGPVILYDDNEANDTDMILYDTQFDDADNYFVELSKGNEKTVLRVNTDGVVFFFKKI